MVVRVLDTGIEDRNPGLAVPVPRTRARHGGGLHHEAKVAARTELARELHDGVAQGLASLVLQLENLKVKQVDAEAVKQEIGALQDRSREMLRDLRHLVGDMRGVPVAKENFVSAIRRGLLAKFERETGVQISLNVSSNWPRRLTREASLNLYRILQEALTNVQHHSAATAVEIHLTCKAGRFAEVTVIDDGHGISFLADGGSCGLGLRGMRERAVLLNGNVEIRNHDGQGTVVYAIFPLESLQ